MNENPTTKPFKFTEKQNKAIEILASPEVKSTLLYGGVRSAKTFLAVNCLITKAAAYPGSQYLISRAKGVSVKATFLLGLFPHVIDLCFPELKSRLSEHKSPPIHISFPNGSVIFFMGIDDVQSKDKMLGYEFTSILFDEVSEIHYSVYTQLMTRLSQGNAAKKSAILTMNPTNIRHWAYKLFIEKKEPVKDEPLSHPERFASLLMNPNDNIENLGEDYVKGLEALSPQAKERFLYGHFSEKIEGSIYSDEMMQAQNENRISTDIKQAKFHYTYAVMDLGHSDLLAWWVVQYLPNKIIFLDYGEKRGSYIIKEVKEILRRGWHIYGIYLPFDAGNHQHSNGIQTIEVVRNFAARLPDKYKFWLQCVPRSSLIGGIDYCRMKFPYCHFAMPACSAGVENLRNYKFKAREEDGITSRVPDHDDASHGADAFRYALQAYSLMFPQEPKPEKDPTKIYLSDIILDEI